MKLTPYQEKALEKIKNERGLDWFAYIDVITLKRPQYTLEILHRKGYLERRYTDAIFSPEYRVVTKAEEGE